MQPGVTGGLSAAWLVEMYPVAPFVQAGLRCPHHVILLSAYSSRYPPVLLAGHSAFRSPCLEDSPAVPAPALKAGFSVPDHHKSMYVSRRGQQAQHSSTAKHGEDGRAEAETSVLS